MHLIPFAVTIPQTEQDRNLLATLEHLASFWPNNIPAGLVTLVTSSGFDAITNAAKRCNRVATTMA